MTRNWFPCGNRRLLAARHLRALWCTRSVRMLGGPAQLFFFANYFHSRITTFFMPMSPTRLPPRGWLERKSVLASWFLEEWRIHSRPVDWRGGGILHGRVAWRISPSRGEETWDWGGR